MTPSARLPVPPLAAPTLPLSRPFVSHGAAISGRRPIQKTNNPRHSHPSPFASFRVFRGPPSPSVVEPRNTRNTRKGARRSRPSIRPDPGGPPMPTCRGSQIFPIQTTNNPRRSDRKWSLDRSVLEMPCRPTRTGTLRRARFILTFLLVTFWVPGSSHAFLQFAGLIHVQHVGHGVSEPTAGIGPACPHGASGPHEHNDSNHSLADGACLLALTDPTSGFCPPILPAPPFPGITSVEPADHPVDQLHSGLAPPSTAPPDLTPRWRFDLRVSLPARSPSPAS